MRLFTKLLGSSPSEPLQFAHDEEPLKSPRVPLYSATSWEWALTSEQIVHEAQNGLIPMTMPLDPIPHQTAMNLWVSWQRHCHRDMRLENGKLLWLPVGRLGPVPVLGHFNPRHAEAETPVATGYFQPVLLTPETYNQYYKRCAELAAEYDAKPPAEVMGTQAPENQFVDDLPVVFDEIKDALRFLYEYYVLSEKERIRIRDLLERPMVTWSTLPNGIRTAIYFLCRRSLVADLTLWHATSAAEELIPSSVRKSARALAAIPGHLWIGVQEILPESAIDEISHHLPETRKIYQVLYDTETGKTTPGAKAGTAFGITKVIQQGSSAKKEQVTLVIDGTIRRVELKKPGNDAREIFKRLCWESIEIRASDLHLEPLISKGLARARVDGSLVELFECSDESLTHLVGAGKDICGMKSDNFDVQDKKFSLKINNDGAESHYTVRVAAGPVRGKGQGLVFRFLPKGGKILKLEELKQPPRILHALRHMIHQEQGLILFCGPTGSGKTTSIAACIQEVNTPDVKIITIEDPIEYELERVMQMEVDDLRDIGFNPLIKEAMRLDPDIALLGEIRDKESADSALKLAVTGHLVFATLHTLSSSRAPLRLDGWEVEPGILAESLIAIVSQRLYPCLCAHCRQTRKPSAFEKSEYEQYAVHGLLVPEMVAVKAHGGCKECRGTGVYRSVAAMEILRNTEEIAALIAKKARPKDLEEQALKQGDTSLRMEALRHAAAGTIDIGDALKAAAVWDQGWEKNY